MLGDDERRPLLAEEHSSPDCTSHRPPANPPPPHTPRPYGVPAASPPPHTPCLYRRRWYCLFVFSLMSAVLGGVGNTFGTIAIASEEAFGWTNADIALLSSWQAVAYIIFFSFFTWLLDTKGLRVSCVLSAFLMALGCGLKCFTTTPPLSDWFFHTGTISVGASSAVVYSSFSLISSTWFPSNQRTLATSIPSIAYMLGSAVVFIIGILVGMASPVTFSGPSTFSNAWFPIHQRTLATSCVVNAFALGALSFIIGPLMVPVRYAPGQNATSSTQTPIARVTEMFTYMAEGTVQSPPNYIQQMRDDISVYLYTQFAAAGLVLVLVVAYFPARPPSPPSNSAALPRTEYKTGVVKIMKNRRFWTLAFVYSATNGLYIAFVSVIEVDLKELDMPNSQSVAGSLVFFAVIGLIISGPIIAKVADLFATHLKALLIGLCIISTVFFLLFALIMAGIIPANMPLLYTSFILASVGMNAGVPLFYEMACEVTYPVAEGLTNGVLNLSNSVLALAFLSVFMIPNIGTAWMNWTMFAAVAICVPVLLLFRPSYSRLHMDTAYPQAHTSVS